MKLKDLFTEDLFTEIQLGVDDYVLKGNSQLDSLKEKILQCEEFSECEELKIIEDKNLITKTGCSIKFFTKAK